MAVGIAALPAIALGIDDMSAAPPWIWIGFLAWLGIYVAFPIWAIRLASRGVGAQYSATTSS